MPEWRGKVSLGGVDVTAYSVSDYGHRMATTPADSSALTADATEFLTQRHLATLTTLRTDGTPHVVAVGFTWDPDARFARVITRRTSQKAINAARGGYAAVNQIEGPLWLTLEGPSEVLTNPDDVRDAEQRYAVRYRVPSENPERVVIRIAVQRVLGSASLLAR